MPFAIVNLAWFLNLIPSLDVDLNVPGILIAQVVLSAWTKDVWMNLILAILHLVDLELGALLPNKATDMPTPFVDVNLALFPNLIPSLDVDLNVQGILIAQVVMSVITKDVLKNLILAILHLVVLELDVWPMEVEMPSAGIKTIFFVTFFIYCVFLIYLLLIQTYIKVQTWSFSYARLNLRLWPWMFEGFWLSRWTYL